MLVVAVLWAAPSIALAGGTKPTYTPAQAIAVMASDPTVGAIRASHPRSFFEASFVAADRTWRVRLVGGPKGHPVLASFAIVDGLGTVLTRSIRTAPGRRT